MITDIPSALQYYLFPLIKKENEAVESVPVGGQKMMDHLGRLITNEDIEGVGGIDKQFCILYVKFDNLTCHQLVSLARTSYDAEAIKIMNA